MIIADACNNHLGDPRIIERMIELCPADYIKFQLYDWNELSPEWAGDREYYRVNQLSDDMVLRIIRLCEDRGIIPLFTIFSLSQADRAAELGVTHAKIASPNANFNFIVEVKTRFSNSLIISTGMCSDAERTQLAIGFPFDTILHCISRYPCVWTEEEKNKALCFDGISDHSTDIQTALWAVRNDLWVERHYTLGKDLPGKDQKISSTPDEFKAIVNERNYLRNVERYKNRWNGKTAPTVAR